MSNRIQVVHGHVVKWEDELPPIESFRGAAGFLSNFSDAQIHYDGRLYSTVEHAFQAAKATNASDREWVAAAGTPGQAKKRGRGIQRRTDWDEVKEVVMWECLVLKFSHPDLARRLAATGKRQLIEGNHWGDRYWGVCDGKGENRLGLLLMLVRQGKRP